MEQFKATHKIVNQADKTRSNGVIHSFKFGTLVTVTNYGWKNHVKVMSEDGTIQFVNTRDLELLK